MPTGDDTSSGVWRAAGPDAAAAFLVDRRLPDHKGWNAFRLRVEWGD